MSSIQTDEPHAAESLQHGSVPDLSVIVPSFQRPDLVASLCARLAGQTLASERFEVIVVDDGSEPPLLVSGPWPFHFELLRQSNTGPAAARNRALERCRAPLCLILNDDAVPAPDLLERHLAVHSSEARAGRAPVAVLGSFHFSPEAVAASPFVELLDRSDLLFDFSNLKHDERSSWTNFWTCNISLSTQALRDAGGFDAANFPDIVEDVELGWRLEQRGTQVLYREDLHAYHDHIWTRATFFPRSVRLGAALVRMYEKHGDPSVLRLAPGQRPDAAFVRRLQATYESLFPVFQKLTGVLERIEVEQRGKSLPDTLVAQLATAIGRVNAVPLARGMLIELTAQDPEPVMQHGASAGRLTSIVVVSHDSLVSTKACIEALRRTRDDAHPSEIFVVDNGSRDGSHAWLTAQHDLKLIRNDTNLGAPHARNQALELVRGDYVVFLDNDVVVTPGWLSKLLFHAEIDARCACVGPVTDRAAHSQAIDYSAGDAGLDAFAGARATSHSRQFRHASLLSSFCLLVKRSVLDEIGGFDLSFSPWGFEDDDFTLRAALNGRHNRIALDTFVRHKAYASTAKVESHTRLLARNWSRFADKWNLAPDTQRGDYGALEPLLAARVARERIHLPLFGQFNECETNVSELPSRNQPCVT